MIGLNGIFSERPFDAPQPPLSPDAQQLPIDDELRQFLGELRLLMRSASHDAGEE